MATVEAPADRLPVSERAWQGTVVAAAKALGWEVYHTRFSLASERGWPDLALARYRPDGVTVRLVFAELKSERGKLSPAQFRWLSLLGDCPGVECYVWRPSQWDEVERVLKGEGVDDADR